VYAGESRISPGYQLLVTSWSSHWTMLGTRAANSRTFWSSRLYANWPRYSASVSATFDFSGVTTLRHIRPSGSVTDSASGPSA
jgi:hypothetical protein